MFYEDLMFWWYVGFAVFVGAVFMLVGAYEIRRSDRRRLERESERGSLSDVDIRWSERKRTRTSG